MEQSLKIGYKSKIAYLGFNNIGIDGYSAITEGNWNQLK